MPEEAAENLSLYDGEELLSWTVEEYERHERGPLWYALAVIAGIGLLVYSVLTQNFLFAVILLMFAVILGLSALHEPEQLPFAITTLGIGVGDSFVPFKNLRSFWILYEPPEVKHVYFEFKSSVTPHLVVPIYDQNPVEIRDTLLEFLDEDLNQEDEPVTRMIARVLKL